MFSQGASKYGLATHLAFAAGLPVALSQFLGLGMLGCVALWLSLLSVVWLVMEPSVFAGETVSLARARVFGGILRDPFAWFLAFATLFALSRWLNSGVRLAFDAETSVWAVGDPLLPLLPASSGDAAFIPFVATVVTSVVALAVRHALGRNARVWFGLLSSAVVSAGALAASICAGLEVEPFASAAVASFGSECFAGSLYALFLPVAAVCGVEAEELGMTKARLVFAWAVAGNAVGAYVFMPPIMSLSCMGAAAILAAAALAFARKRVSTAAMARAFAMLFFGVVMAAFAVMSMPNRKLRAAKSEGLSVEKAFPAAVADRDAALRRIAEAMWLDHPWSGVGVGAFPLQAPFSAVEDDWLVLPPEPKHGSNLYFTLLAERGIVGSLVWAVWLGFLLWFWASRLVAACRLHSRMDEGRGLILFLPTVVWVGPVTLALAAADAWFSVGGALSPLAVCVAVAMPLSAASFPKARRVAVDMEDNA